MATLEEKIKCLDRLKPGLLVRNSDIWLNSASKCKTFEEYLQFEFGTGPHYTEKQIQTCKTVWDVHTGAVCTKLHKVLE